MKILKKILKIVVSLIILLIASIWIYTTTLAPSYEGSLELEHLNKETSVYFDEYGIPHIYAENQEDALTALGYVHAQDRLWQMELIRRIAPGRLSEIFGKDMLKNDRFFVSLGIEEASLKSIEKLDQKGEIYNLATAYLNGVNQYIENGKTPIEFTLTGIEKEFYELKDIYNILGYMSFSFAMAHKTDPLLSVLKERLGELYFKDLDLDVNPNSTLIKNAQPTPDFLEELTVSVNHIMQKSPVPPFVGSNSWVVSPKKTATGKVLFANDPHIGYSQPAVWFEAHISTPDYEMYGYHLAGVPFPLLGHNRDYAYGLTMFENDDLDFYKEENHPTDNTKYKTPTGYQDYTIREKHIKIKGGSTETVLLKSSRHGPIMNNAIEQISQTEPIAMSWVYTKFEVEILDALYTISRAKEMKDVKKGASMIHAPGLNIMYGDAKGNVAWWAAGKLYKHKPHVNRKFILNGATGEDDPVEYLNFDQNPMAENPDWEYVYSANNQPDTIANILYPGYYVPEDRAKRIVQFLEKKNDWNVASFSTMINDVTSSVSPAVIKELSNNLKTSTLSKKELKVLETLQQWDSSNTVDNIAPTIYNKWVYLYLKFTFEDEMGEKVFNQLLNTHLMKRVIADHIQNINSIWWDDISTEIKIETRKDILSKAFKQTVIDLERQLGEELNEWKWGKVHTLEHRHPLGSVKLLRKFFNLGPYSMNGAREVIDNRGYNYDETGIFNIISGPSTRRIIDFSDIENSISILPTGQSGNPFSIHYNDQVSMYNKGAFRKMKLNKEEIINNSTKLIILPKNE